MRCLPSLLAGLVLGHVVFGLLRVPHAAVARRLEEIDAVETQGRVAFAFESAYKAAYRNGADVVQLLLDTTPEDAVVPVRGDFKGALELAVALLWPRLCVRAEHVSGGVYGDRPVVDRVLVGDGAALRLESR
ncbi:MAG: hypothetical protein AB7O97_14935 [Planctomycetota bacterium]